MQLLQSLMAATALVAPALATTTTTTTPRFSPPAPVSKRQSTSCNSSPDLCSKPYNQVTHMGVHDAPFLRDESTGDSVAGNQYLNATKALDAGFRLLQGQVHVESDGSVKLCHTNCGLLDAGLLQDWLSEVTFWIDNHPNDVVTVLLVNSEDGNGTTLTADDFGRIFDASGMGQFAYVPDGSGWPSLSTMIDNGDRAVTFVTNISGGSQAYPYVLDEFQFVFETSFEVTSASGFNCQLDRPTGVGQASEAIAAGLLPLINHFQYQELGTNLFVPDVGEIEKTNSPDPSQQGSVAAHAQQCQREWGVQPVFILVDFWNEGPAIQAADQLNQVQTATGRIEAAPGEAESGASEGVMKGSGLVAAVAIAAALVL